MEQIDPDKVETRDTEDIDDERFIEIGIGEPRCYDKQYCSDQETRAYLEYECELEEVLRFSVFVFDDIFRQKIVQTLCTSKIVERSEKSHKTNHPIDHTYSLD